MTNYRHHKNQKRSASGMDGFVTRPSTGGDTSMAKRFRVTGRPSASVPTQPIDGMRTRREDGFYRRQTIETPAAAQPFIDEQMHELEDSYLSDVTTDQQVPKKEGKRLLRFRKSEKQAHRRPKKRLNTVVRGFAVIIVATLIGIVSLMGYGFIKQSNIFKGSGEGALALQKNIDPAKLNGEGDGRVNMLLIGKGGEGHTAPDLTDTLLLASIDPIQNEASLVSIPRDLYVQDSRGYSSKINAVYSNAKQAHFARSDGSDADREAAEAAGLTSLKTIVSDVLGVPVHYYAMVDFEAFKEAIDTVGGITVDVKEPLYDESVAWLLGGNPLVAGEGLQTFDGHRALLYARSRKGSARGDFDRTERQRELLVALQKEVISAETFSNPFKVVELMNSFGNRVRTDLNGPEELKRLYEIGKSIGSDRIGSVGLADPPNVLVKTGMLGDQSVVMPVAGINNYEDIHNYIRNNLRDAFLKSEDARIVILNGTSTPGLANSRQKELQSYGYNVVKIENAPTADYVDNVLVDISNGNKKYTKNYLEKRLGITATNTAPAGIAGADTADFVIILGSNEASQNTN